MKKIKFNQHKFHKKYGISKRKRFRIRQNKKIFKMIRKYKKLINLLHQMRKYSNFKYRITMNKIKILNN